MRENNIDGDSIRQYPSASARRSFRRFERILALMLSEAIVMVLHLYLLIYHRFLPCLWSGDSCITTNEQELLTLVGIMRTPTRLWYHASYRSCSRYCTDSQKTSYLLHCIVIGKKIYADKSCPELNYLMKVAVFLFDYYININAFIIIKWQVTCNTSSRI